ncbi:MAG: AMP-binding protein [Desulfovibrio sp.]|jgi:long-chain acyl-CoA synthetase|nr:AMP-binding protein [Desulfovibrio sp.]
MPEASLSPRTLHRLLAQSAERYADKAALSSVSTDACARIKTISYRELHAAVTALSARLAEKGIAFGDSVAILAENSPNWGIAYLAVTCMGAVAVPILSEFHSDAVTHIIRHSETKAVFVSRRLSGKIAGPPPGPGLIYIDIENFTFEGGDEDKAPLRALKDMEPLRALKDFRNLDFKKGWGKAEEKSAPERREPAEDDLAAIIYTSGTSGHSKGVMLTHRNITANALCIQDIVTLYEGDRMLSVLPLPHAFECTLGLALPLLHGVHIHYADHRTPALRALLPVLGLVRPTVMLVVPLVMEKIFKAHILPKLRANPVSRLLYRLPPLRRLMHRAAGKKLHSTFGGELRIMAIGGAPLSTDAERFMLEANFPFAVGYGLTEASPLLSGAGPGRGRPGSAGPAITGTRLRLSGCTKANGGAGEIEALGPSIMRGYFKQPELSAEAFTPDGWLRTGDLAVMDADGYVHIRGRVKNVILGPSGENIYPEEVESFFSASPYVLEALVYRKDGKLCARAHLDAAQVDEIINGLSGADAEAKRRDLLEEIRAQVNSKVSAFARIAKIIEQVEPFEKTATQKIKRYLYVDP